MRIPNWLTLPALGLALVYAGVAAGLDGVLFGLAGAGTAFGLLFLPFAARWMGAGDVKAIMVLGALWGASVVLGLVWWSILVGGVLGLCWLMVRGELQETIARWFRSAHLAATTRTFTYFPPDPGSAATARLPFGVAIGLSVAAYQLWGTPWA